MRSLVAVKTVEVEPIVTGDVRYSRHGQLSRPVPRSVKPSPLVMRRPGRTGMPGGSRCSGDATVHTSKGGWPLRPARQLSKPRSKELPTAVASPGHAANVDVRDVRHLVDEIGHETAVILAADAYGKLLAELEELESLPTSEVAMTESAAPPEAIDLAEAYYGARRRKICPIVYACESFHMLELVKVPPRIRMRAVCFSLKRLSSTWTPVCFKQEM